MSKVALLLKPPQEKKPDKKPEQKKDT